MQEKWREKGLAAVGVHVKPSVQEDALALCRREGINFPNYAAGTVEWKGVDGTPTVFFFDFRGNQVHKGSFAGHEKELEGMLEAAPDYLTGPGEYAKVAKEADQVRKRAGLGEAVKSLRAKAGSEDAEEREEASRLLARVERWVEGRFKRADSRLEAGCPDQAAEMWKALAREFAGDQIAEKAAAVDREKAADPGFKREMDALKKFRVLEKCAESLKPRRTGQDEDSWRKRNQDVIAQLLAMARSLEKSHAGTRVAARAAGYLKGLGVN